MIIVIFGQTAFIGLNSGMETLASQAFGANNLQLCGQYFLRGRILIFAYCIPLTVVFLSSEWALRSIGQSEVVSAICRDYLIGMLPAVYIIGQNDL